MRPFKKKEKLKINDIYIFRQNEKNPFASPAHKVQIKDIKNGYVLYKFCGAPTILQNESMLVSSFQHCYKLYQE